MSFTYNLVEVITSWLSQKKTFSLNAEQLILYLKAHNNNAPTFPPKNITKNYDVTSEMFCGRPCYKICTHNVEDTPVKKCVLFLHGGGYMFGMHQVHWAAVLTILKETSVPVWVPDYPLLPTATIAEMTQMITNVYSAMRAVHPNTEIIFLGDSAGADLALTFCHHNKAILHTAMPNKLILVSPANATEEDPEILAAMQKIQKHDAMLSVKLLKSMPVLFKQDSAKAPYYILPLDGDFEGFPPCFVFSGTHDIFYPQIPPFVEQLKNAGVVCEFIRGEGMMHVWPYMPLAPECKKALTQIIDMINR